MAVAASPEPILEPGVREVLQRHEAEEEFAKACALVRECFPELRAIHAWVLVDPNENYHARILLRILMPAGHPPDLLQAQRERYFEEFLRGQPTYYPLSFSLAIGSAQE